MKDRTSDLARKATLTPEERKLEIDEEKNQIEREKVRLEERKLVWTVVGLGVPLATACASLAITSYFSYMSIQTQTRTQAANAIVNNTMTSSELRSKVAVFRKFFPSTISAEIEEVLNDPDFRINDGVPLTVELFKQLSNTRRTEDQLAILENWGRVFPGGRSFAVGIQNQILESNVGPGKNVPAPPGAPSK